MKKDKMYKMMMSLCKGSWDINSALCGCPAGKGPSASCKDIGVHLQSFVSLVSYLSLYNMHRCLTAVCPKKQDPITVDELKSRRQEILNQNSKSQPIPTLYDPRPPSMRMVDHKSLEQLRLNLLSIDHHCAAYPIL